MMYGFVKAEHSHPVVGIIEVWVKEAKTKRDHFLRAENFDFFSKKYGIWMPYHLK
jgi:hypothetical protein